MLFAADIALEPEFIAAAITIALPIQNCIYSFGCTPTQHFQSKPSRDFALTEALTSEVGLLQYFRACKKWIPFSSNFYEVNSRM